jgi:NAD(P)-dependent dehydrogenase (short-subunit alcohol dehydrogenase family)
VSRSSGTLCFAGHSLINTGGDSGIGRAIAILFAKEGADSFIVYLPEEEQDAQETKKRVEAIQGRKCHLHATDVRTFENCEKAFNAARQAMGQVNILVNNAAFQMMKQDITEIPLEQWHKTFDTNIHPYFYFAKLAIPHMKRGDTIVINASVNAYVGRPDLLDYTSTKGGMFCSLYSCPPGLLESFPAHFLSLLLTSTPLTQPSYPSPAAWPISRSARAFGSTPSARARSGRP